MYVEWAGRRFSARIFRAKRASRNVAKVWEKSYWIAQEENKNHQTADANFASLRSMPPVVFQATYYALKVASNHRIHPCSHAQGARLGSTRIEIERRRENWIYCFPQLHVFHAIQPPAPTCS